MVPRWRIPGAKSFREALSQASNRVRGDQLGPGDIAFLQYTGGTTGRAKGRSSPTQYVANVEQTAAWIGATLKEGEETIVTACRSIMFLRSPESARVLKLGGNDVLITNPRDIAASSLSSPRPVLPRYRVNTLFNALLDAEGSIRSHRGARVLKLAVAGGMALQRPLPNAGGRRWESHSWKATGSRRLPPACARLRSTPRS